MNVEIEMEIDIASFRQDSRKYQDCLLSGNLFQDLIGTELPGAISITGPEILLKA